MSLSKTFLTVTFTALLALGCNSNRETKKPETPVAESTTEKDHIHDLSCGCALEEVGHCGEYIKVEEKFIELVGDLELGKMPFCKKEGLKARVEGEVKDGKFVATSFAYVKAK